MNPNKPSLYLYFAACIFAVLFKLLEWDSTVLFIKSLIVPIVFTYYLITNGYKISAVKAIIFLLCFIGDLFNLLKLEISVLGSLLSFLLAYTLLLKLAYNDFKRFRFNEKDRILIFISFFIVIIIFFSLFNLFVEEIDYYLYLYFIYGLVLSLLVFVVITNYLKKQNYAFFYFVIVCVCMFLSDVFYMINTFYLNLYALNVIGLIVQVLSYFFLVNYFIVNDRYILKTTKS